MYVSHPAVRHEDRQLDEREEGDGGRQREERLEDGARVGGDEDRVRDAEQELRGDEARVDDDVPCRARRLPADLRKGALAHAAEPLAAEDRVVALEQLEHAGSREDAHDCKHHRRKEHAHLLVHARHKEKHRADHRLEQGEHGGRVPHLARRLSVNRRGGSNRRLVSSEEGAKRVLAHHPRAAGGSEVSVSDDVSVDLEFAVYGLTHRKDPRDQASPSAGGQRVVRSGKRTAFDIRLDRLHLAQRWHADGECATLPARNQRAVEIAHAGVAK
mmetsp:Transcript_9708/g.31751  ORF Transcript_9708/g.31751 Transcript_9708/m.31751 type:complete len:272 (+) Transcript_9708:902-1717(+)